MIHPTPLPIPTFDPDASDASAVHLLEYLQNLSDQFASGNAQTSEDYRDECLHLIKSLNNYLLKRFPSPHEYVWSTLHERTKLTEVTLEFIPRATLCVGDIFHGKDSFAKSLVLRLLDVCHVLDVWLDVPDIPIEDGYSPPSVLRSKAVEAIVAVLRCLGNSVKRENENEGDNPPGWEMMRSLANECIEACRDMELAVHTDGAILLSFFTQPRITAYSEEKISESDALHIRVSCPAEFPLIMTSMLEVFLNIFHPSLLSQSLVADTFYRLVTAAQRTYHYLLSTACRTTASKRARSTARLVSGLSRALQDCAELAPIGETLRSHVLLSRIKDGPTEAWKSYDNWLKESLSVSLPASISTTNLKAIVAALTLETWGDGSQSLHDICCAYVRTSLQHLETESLNDLQNMLSKARHRVDIADLSTAITTRLDALGSNHDGSSALTVTDVHPWRDRLRAITQAIIEPDDLGWMDDDESTSDTSYMSRAITDIDARFEKPLYNPSASSRTALARELLRLPCAMAHHPDSGCPMEPSKSVVNPLQPCLRLSPLLLEGPEGEATPLVRKAVYDALARSINHQTSAYGGGKLQHATQLAARGMKDADRSVRLSAGHCLVELVKLYQRLGRHSTQQTDSIFNTLSNTLAASDTRLQETAVITCGSIAKIATPELLVKALLPLLSMLGQSNPISKGVAYMQLSAIAKVHEKTNYNFLSPLMDRLAPFLVTQIRKQPTVLHELSQFLNVRLQDFYNVTLVHTLPQIFANQDRQTLEAISTVTQKKCHALFLSHESKILARAFMASKPGQTRAILNFITSVLNEAAGSGSIDIDSLIGSSIVNLIAELVLYMGDEEPGVIGEAVNALVKVERIVSANEKTATKNCDPIPAFLEPHMLGIITHLNDVLQNKQTVDVKRRAIRSLGAFVNQVGSTISNVAPQVLATLQSTLMVDELADVTLESWDVFLRKLDVQDIGSYVGPTSAAIVGFWEVFSIRARDAAKRCLEYIVIEIGGELAQEKKLNELADLSAVPDFKPLQTHATKLRGATNGFIKLQHLLNRITNDNQLVVERALEELKLFLVAEEPLIRRLSSGGFFDPLISQTMSALLLTTSRDGESADGLRLLAFECVGALGALDPDRLELEEGDAKMVVTSNFTDDVESADFVVHLIKDVLVGAFRSTSDTQYQTQLAYTIQELMRFCNFTSSLVTPGSAGTVSSEDRDRWNALPKHVIETITPFLASRYTLNAKPMPPVDHPIYPIFPTYREWISAWTSSLLDQVSGPQAQAIFSVFAAVIRNRDVGVAHHLLPHLVLNVLISGKREDVNHIRTELLCTLQDQVDPNTKSTADKRDLSAQTVFSLMDHLNKWVRTIRQKLSTKKSNSRRHRLLVEDQLARVNKIVSSIDQNLMARAALRCKAYARALMSFEQQVVTLRSAKDTNTLSDHYERLHEIYAQLDEPDGMEGITTLILTPSLEHQIRQNESTGRWTAAQSCWEVQLQGAPDELTSHLGLLRCLRNIGHYDTLRTHVEGVLHRRPDWESELIGYQVESACMLGKWEEVKQLVGATKAESSAVLIAKVLLAMRSGDKETISSALAEARWSMGGPIVAAGPRGYRRSYEAALDLHLLHELRVIYDHMMKGPGNGKTRLSLTKLDRRLAARLESIQPSFRFREPVLSLRRTALALRTTSDIDPLPYIGQSWLLSAKLARKSGYSQTAYSAVLQAQQLKTAFSFIESVKLTRLNGEPLRAVQDLEHWLNLTEKSEVIDLTGEDMDRRRLWAKALLLRAKWEREFDRFDAKDILVMFQNASDYGGRWESGLFHYGQYQDESFKNLSQTEKIERGAVMNLNTIKWFGESMLYGDKYIYQTVPRLLTLWLELTERHLGEKEHKETNKATVFLMKHTGEAPAYKWYTAFAQLVSRIDHPHPAVWKVLSRLIVRIIQEYPRQALWGFAAALHSQPESLRKHRAQIIYAKVKSGSSKQTYQCVLAIQTMTHELLAMCNSEVPDKKLTFSMSKDFSGLFDLAPSELIIPLQESLTASLPPAGSSPRDHEPFPIDAPKFQKFVDEMDVMQSMAKPKKITIEGSDGLIYKFLAKPKDDLRKDARLMDLFSVINKTLKSNSEYRRRRLRIRTYGVVTLGETGGLIQWVPNTIPIRHVVAKLYESRNLRYWRQYNQDVFDRIKLMSDDAAAVVFKEKVLIEHPSVMHEWFIETFPEPSVWLASRLAYSRTNAVMCMVGFILGLGDRHMENILLDANTGDLVHVDFNCIFEKGKTLEIPERVPFRLTHNIVDGLGVTGVEGVFRIACELSLQLLRDNKDTLMSILDAFIHDPLTDWQEEKTRMLRKRGNPPPDSIDLKALAKNALKPIGKKLKGIYTFGPEKVEKEVTTSTLVQLLIEEATDIGRLAKMYPGWAPWA
ncbi:hypothetical protein BDY19DRAFT_928481 [Irpex rosettiformis]|uniref:Uncharacterized protein n=1 Tax=Irpex rosettiformis TaxID=378272 RepID=A0ACB8UD36_9APHY|nr:hypothetical protein BDY19DRAFT_928481 [Irpex rosettiformis]